MNQQTDSVIREIEKVIVGKRTVVERVSDGASLRRTYLAG